MYLPPEIWELILTHLDDQDAINVKKIIDPRVRYTLKSPLDGSKLRSLPFNVYPTIITNYKWTKTNLSKIRGLFLIENQPLTPGMIPPTLQFLSLGEKFKRQIDDNVLPENLETLIFDWKFNQPLPRLPSKLKILQLRGRFNQPLPELPETLTELKLGVDFNQPLSRLPPRLEVLELSDRFCQPISNLPSSLRVLTIGNNFHSPLNQLVLPDGLVSLEIWSPFPGNLRNLPLSLDSLYLEGNVLGNIDYLPPHLVQLFCSRLQGKINYLPPSLQYLEIDRNYSDPIPDIPGLHVERIFISFVQ